MGRNSPFDLPSLFLFTEDYAYARQERFCRLHRSVGLQREVDECQQQLSHKKFQKNKDVLLLASS